VDALPKRVREAPPRAKHAPAVTPAAVRSRNEWLLKGPPAALAVLSCLAAGELNPFVWLLMYVICLVPWGAFLLAALLWLDFLASPDRVTGSR
jgi:hypothetical protein